MHFMWRSFRSSSKGPVRLPGRRYRVVGAIVVDAFGLNVVQFWLGAESPSAWLQPADGPVIAVAPPPAEPQAASLHSKPAASPAIAVADFSSTITPSIILAAVR